MKAYGQFCPLAQATQILCERWTLLVIRELIAGSTRFSELQKGVPLMSPSLLSTRLNQLHEEGIISRSGKKGSYVYALTEAGQELRSVIELMGAWGHRWARSKLEDDDLDAGLLMWDMRRSVDPAVFPARRIVVQFNYPDAPKGARHWWLVSEQGEIDLCLNDPGHEIDIIINSPLKTMTSIWSCQSKLNDELDKGKLSVMGDPKLISKLQSWLRSSLLSHLGTVEKLPELQWH